MKVISMFAGCGGLDLGLQNAGHKIVFASDIDKDSCETYNLNFKHKCHQQDIKELDTSIFPNYDILVGGFPCQGFSIANLYRSSEDDRNSLYQEIIRLLDETSPKFFLAENVPGILSLEKGKAVELIQQGFESAGNGYEVRRYLLNAAEYGVPQNRKRVIFLGISKCFSKEHRNKMYAAFPPTPTNSNSTDTPLSPFKSLKDCIGDLPEPDSTKGKAIPNHIGNSHKVKINGYMGNRKLSWDKPGPTIVGRGGGTGGPVIAVHPNLKRRFTVRETARIQTFPDNFIFTGSISSQYRQIGNAVAVDFAEKLGEALLKIEKLSRLNKTSKKSGFISV